MSRPNVFVVCGNPDCHRNAELNVNGLPDNVTFGDLRSATADALCTECDHRGAEVSRHGCTMTDWSRHFEDPITLPDART
jgi:hypothetical protein